jgi:hypothetical protein
LIVDHQSILRELGENFTIDGFEHELENRSRDFNPAQVAGLKQRMSLLETFINRRPKRQRNSSLPRFASGQLTIIDLSDPFVDAASACSLFEIITRLFVRADVGTGKVLVVDEAHKVRPSFHLRMVCTSVCVPVPLGK